MSRRMRAACKREQITLRGVQVNLKAFVFDEPREFVRVQVRRFPQMNMTLQLVAFDLINDATMISSFCWN